MLTHESGKNTKNCEAVLLTFLFSVIIRQYFVLAFSRLKKARSARWDRSYPLFGMRFGWDIFPAIGVSIFSIDPQGYIVVVTREGVKL